MAFRILEEAEIALLTEKQKEQYQKDVDAYIRRVKFLELIDAIENIKVKVCEPDWSKIKIIEQAEVKAYEMPVIKTEKASPISKIEMQFPKYECEELKRIEVPKIDALEVKVDTYVPSERKSLSLPTVKTIKRNFKEIRPLSEYSPEIPEIDGALYDSVSEYKGIERDAVVLPKVKAIDFDVENKTPFKLEKDIVGEVVVKHPKIDLNAFKNIKKIEVNIKSEISKRPEIKAIKVEAQKEFAMPEKVKISLPQVPKIDVELKEFATPEKVKISLPQAPQIAVKRISFEQPRVSVPKIKNISIPAGDTSKVTFEKTRMTKMPKVSGIDMPNPYEDLKELLV